MEAGQLAPMCDRGLEDPGNRDERQWDHRQEGEYRREQRPEADAEVGRDEEEQDPDDRDPEGRVRDERVDRREAARRVQVEAVREVERREDHVQRRHREPAEPVRPGRHPVDVLRRPWPLLPEGGIGVRGCAAGPLGHHRRELRQEQAEDVPGEGDDDDHGDRRGPEGRHHDGSDACDENRPGEADHERAPPVRLLFQPTPCVIELLLVRRHPRLLERAAAAAGEAGRTRLLLQGAGATGIEPLQWTP